LEAELPFLFITSEKVADRNIRWLLNLRAAKYGIDVAREDFSREHELEDAANARIAESAAIRRPEGEGDRISQMMIAEAPRLGWYNCQAQSQPGDTGPRLLGL
jgi:hypothetical protein